MGTLVADMVLRQLDSRKISGEVLLLRRDEVELNRPNCTTHLDTEVG